MKNPEETIVQFDKFIDRVESQHWKVCFLFTGGYLLFIEHLGKRAQKLARVCDNILKNHGEDGLQDE